MPTVLRLPRVFILAAVLASPLAAADKPIDLMKNGDFTGGAAPWDGLGTDADHDASIATVDGHPVLRLKRITKGANVTVTQYNLGFKPQTWYRLSATGWGTGPGALSLRLQSKKDPEFDKVVRSWATSSCPMPNSATEPMSESLVIDSGLVPESAYLNLRLDGEEPGEYAFRSLSLIELGSSKPDPKHLVLAHLGDSITITSYLPFSKRVDALLAPMLAKAFPKRDIRQMNLATDGESIAELFDTKRYEKVIKSNYQKIDIAVIRYGANDSRAFPPAEFKKKVVLLCEALEKDYPGIRIVLGTGPWVKDSADINKQYGGHWQVLRDVAAERKYPLAEITKRFEQEASSATGRSPSDMHPSPLGVTLVADAEFAVLKPLLEAMPEK
ncbi:MAG: SGNH/GDSL hydrolase family protein [Planctomycetes bacterium]|nr:SGNH/GDSL hydrolase family protein [Planctomycetota bacterium]